MLLSFYWINTKLAVLLMNWHIKLFRTNTRLTTTQNNYHFDIFLRSVIFLSGIKESHTGLLCFVYHQRCLLFHLCDKKSFQSPPLSFDPDQLNPESESKSLSKQASKIRLIEFEKLTKLFGKATNWEWKHCIM